jgi:2,3-bisphosphoglycerate-independent phosphoglycerate mutase
MSQVDRPKPVILCVLDGWGDGEAGESNAIARAETPIWDALRADCPGARLDASEHHVGLPAGQMGNSEVGHMNLGAGRIVLQDLPRIDQAIADGSLAANPRLADFTAALRESGGTAHLMGLLSPGGVHSHQAQMAFLARQLSEAGIPVAVHAFLDGRDTPPSSGAVYMRTFLDQSGGATVATVSGRFHAMDRDKRWDRIAGAYSPLVEGTAARAADPVAAIEAAYEKGETDEFMTPTVIGDFAGMRDGDGLLMANFRADRAREILAALLDPTFDGFDRPRRVAFAAALGMVEYAEILNPFMETLFPPVELRRVLGEIVSGAGLSQLRIAETEKYAHVTFFFNGGREAVFEGEDRILVASPKVATYDLQPEMSAPEVTDNLVEAIGSGRFDFVLVNYANTDMVGHTGKIDAAIEAVEAVDACLGRLRDAVDAAGGVLLITADHGNAEKMVDQGTGETHTAHTRNPVPALLFGATADQVTLRDGCLADVAPTLLALMGLAQPAEMTGRSLLAPLEGRRATG